MNPSAPSHTPRSMAPAWTVGDLVVHRIDETELPRRPAPGYCPTRHPTS